MRIDKELQNILGESYGGPSLSYSEEEGGWVIFKWYDAPPNTEIVARGETLKKCIESYWRKFKKGRIPK